MFQLTDEEMQDWRSQIVITNSINMGVRRKVYAFTELCKPLHNSVNANGIIHSFITVLQKL